MHLARKNDTSALAWTIFSVRVATNFRIIQIMNLSELIILSKNTIQLQTNFMFDYDKREILIYIPPRRGFKNGDYSFMVETYEIFHTFFTRYNVDLDILHEMADGPWLPGGELQNDWVCHHTHLFSVQSPSPVFKSSLISRPRACIAQLISSILTHGWPLRLAI